jgi:hypothetical protein
MLSLKTAPKEKAKEETYTIHFEQLDIKLSKEAALQLLATLTEALDEKKVSAS